MQLNRISAFMLISVCLAGSQSVAQAEDELEPLPEVIVTGTVIGEESIYRHIPKYSLEANEINALRSSTVVDLLRGVPGLDVSQQGGEGGLTFISIRGGDPNFTVVLIDGIKVDDPTNSRGGGFDFAGLDPLMIERIDVFYGGFSAVYGSDALGGIISVTTNGTSSYTRAGTVEAGTNDAWAVSIHVSGPISDAISGSVSGVVRQGNNAIEGDSLERKQLSLKLANTPGQSSTVNWGLNFFASEAEATAFPIASGGDQLAVIRDVEERNFDQISTGGRIEWSPATNWQTGLAAGWARYKENNDSPGIAPGILSGVPPILTGSSYERANVTFSNTVMVSEAFIFGFGAEAIHENGDIDSLIDFGFPLPADFSRTRDTWAVFGEAAINLNKQLTLIASMRHDDVEEITSTNARIAANFEFDLTNTSASVIYAEGFKVPSLFALGHPLTGNLDLKPERSESISLNLQQPLFDRKAILSLGLYHNKFKDLVDFDPSIFLHVNRASATTEGLDVSLRSELNSELQLSGNVGYLNMRVNDGTKLERRPKWKGNFTLVWTPNEKWLASLNGKINGDFYEVSVPTGEVLLDGYTDIDISIQRSLTDKIDVKFLIDNLFDNGYEEVVAFLALEGRHDWHFQYAFDNLDKLVPWKSNNLSSLSQHIRINSKKVKSAAH